MREDEEVLDAVDVQPCQGSPDPAKITARAFPWVILVVGVVVAAGVMAAITISTVPLSVVTAPAQRR